MLRLIATLTPDNKVRLWWKAVPGRRYEILFANGLERVFQPLSGAGFPRVATSTGQSLNLTKRCVSHPRMLVS